MSEKSLQVQQLATVAGRVPQIFLDRLVSHRGFHWTDDNLTRPLENTLEAFSCSWEAGFQMCECDVTHDADGNIVICHDKNFKRVAKNKNEISRVKVERLSTEAISSIELADGSRPLSLDSCLSWLSQFGPKTNSLNTKKLIVEIKNTADPHIISQALIKRLEHLQNVPIIMSFSRDIIMCLAGRFQSLDKSISRPILMILVELDEFGFQHPKDLDWKFDLGCVSCVDQVCERLLREGEVRADGVYLQFEERMVTKGEARENMRKLCEKTNVGVFFSRHQIDRLHVVQKLVELGVKFVNTDVPPGEDFFLPETENEFVNAAKD